MGTFAETLRALLQENDLSQAELARRIGLSAQAVSGWFASGITPSRENVERIEALLPVDPPGELLRLAGYASDRSVQPTVESLIRAHPRIEQEDKRVLVFLVQRAIERYDATHPA